MADEPKVNEPDEKKPPAKVVRAKRVVVDELRDVAVSIGYSTVIFRPGQRLDSPHLIETAKQHNIAVREV